MLKKFKMWLFLSLGIVLIIGIISIYFFTHKSMSVESITSATLANVKASAIAAALDANTPPTNLQPATTTTADLTKFEESQPIKTQHFYIVHEGDVLSVISQKFYGTVRKVNQICEANRDIIKDKNLLRPGTKLIIPM